MSVQLHRYTHENINYLLVWKLFLVVLVMRSMYDLMINRFITG